MKMPSTLLFNLLFFLFVASSAIAQDSSSKAQSKFASKLIGAVNVQKERKAYHMVYKEFRKNYNGSKSDLLSELFAARFSNNKEYSKIAFEQIHSIRLVEVVELQGGILLYKFILETTQGPASCNIYLRTKGKKMGFIPAEN
ncbi:MAG: hypothetical protein WC044_02920 [Crocinitomicaceae bacterium]